MRDPVARLLGMYAVVGTCWLWTGGVGRGGYGRLNVGGKPVAVHRFAYETWVGPIPDGLHIDHLCRVPNCFNPEHLEAVTAAENNRRSVQARFGGYCGKGHPHPMGKQCEVCHRAAYEARKARRHATGELQTANGLKDQCKRGHTFDAENTIVIPRGRQCRACTQERDRRRHLDPERRAANIARSRAWHDARRARERAAI